jgi:branched-subunit amino acid ABC-type transport system permease component
VVAVAAVLYAVTYPVDPYIGLSLTVKAFTVIVLGGIGNLPGSLIAGLFLGTTARNGARLGVAVGRTAVLERNALYATNIGTEAVVTAPADGYTLLLAGPAYGERAALGWRSRCDTTCDPTPTALCAA